MVTHSSTLAWKIPWMEEPGRLQSMGSSKSRTRLSDFTLTFHFHALEKEMATNSSVLAWRIPGTVGCRLRGRTESDTIEVIQQQQQQLLRYVGLFAGPSAVAHQAPLSMGFPRQEYQSGLPFPNPGIEPMSPALQVESLPLSHQVSSRKFQASSDYFIEGFV